MADEEKKEDQTENVQTDEDIMKLWQEAMSSQEEKEEEEKKEEKSKEEKEEDFTPIQKDIYQDIQRILDIPLNIDVVVGKTKILIKDLLGLKSGSIVSLDSNISDPVSIYVNGKLIAKGELVVVGENFGVRILEIIEKEERIKSLTK